MNASSRQFALPQLPLAPRLVLAAFLASTGLGYCAALVQLHFQHAARDTLLPGLEEVLATYHGGPDRSRLEQLLTADEGKPFNGSGSMRAAFTTHSGGLRRAIREQAEALSLDPKQPRDWEKAQKELFRVRDGERLALLAWVRDGARKQDYDQDRFALPGDLVSQPITDRFLNDDGSRTVKIRSILEARCVRCHGEGAGGAPANCPLDSYERVRDYCEVEAVGAGMSLVKLAQTTHVHLLGLGMLYGLTGVIFAFTSYPGWLRTLLGPLPLLAQVLEIGCWWLARWDPWFATAIMGMGGLVGLGLFLQVVLSLFNLFGKRAKLF